jgi:hypothetical protein
MITEQHIRSVETCLKQLTDKSEKQWDRVLPYITFQLRQLPCESLDYSAHQLTFGENFPDNLHSMKDELIGDADPDETQMQKDLLTYGT